MVAALPGLVREGDPAGDILPWATPSPPLGTLRWKEGWTLYSGRWDLSSMQSPLP